MTLGFILGVGGAGFICGVAVMYLVMIRTHRKRVAEANPAETVAA